MMKPVFAVMAVALLGACAGNRFEADVTRFHIAAPTKQGSVYLEPLDKAAAGTLEFHTYAAAVATELRETGFAITDTRAGSEYVGVISYGQTTRTGAPSSSPFTIGIGGGSFGRNVGIGLGTSFGVGKKKTNETAINMLALQLKRTSDAVVVWEGRAIAEAPESGKYGPLLTAIPSLADALLRDFPGTSGQTVTYKAAK